MTAAEIAKIAGVSRSTVTAVINDYSHISEKTKNKVKKIIEEYGYVPNSSARGLVGKKAKVIGLFLYEDEDLASSNYYSNFILNIVNSAQQYNYTVTISILKDKNDSIKISNFFSDGSIQGAIISGGDTDISKILKIIKRNYPLVLVDKISEKESLSENAYIVNRDNFNGAYSATKYLIDKGHKDIVFIGGTNYRLSSIERLRGYTEALRDNRMEIQKRNILYGNFSVEMAENLMNKYLKNNTPTAVFCVNDMSAIGVLHSLKKYNLHCPKDISIIGFDNLIISREISPKLTTVKSDSKILAEESIKLLVKAIDSGKIENRNLIIKSEIIERESVCKNY